MVCEKCEKKLTKVIVPDKWKAGASNTTEGGGRKINENKLLSKKNRCVSERTVLANCFILLSSLVKESVQCAVSRYLTPRFTNRAMYDADQILAAFSVSAFP
ncbi:cysteine-rich pdz-binding protein [Quercus suber]|uniref:Cysteine-rich PDZ-binding protein n=1 Tax=Quercus suber TaxID=58331 RepID=A0AAW0IPR5_QUESU